MMKGRSGEVLWDDTIRLARLSAEDPRECARIRGEGAESDRAGSSNPSFPIASRSPMSAAPAAAQLAWGTLSTDSSPPIPSL